MMKSIMLSVILTLVFVVATPPSSMAQDKTQDAEKSGPLNFIIKEEDKEKIDFDKLFNELPEDIQVDLAQEAEQQYYSCQKKGTYSHYYDCKCIAEEYLHARIMQGPEIGTQNLLSDVTLKCPNAAGIAGYQYQKCESRFAMDVVFNLDKFCTCYANNIAKNFAEKPSMNSQYVNLLTVRAMDECGYNEDERKYEKLRKEEKKIR